MFPNENQECLINKLVFPNENQECLINKLRVKSIKWTWAEPFEMNVKIEQELNFVVDKDMRLFLNSQEAKKVSERTVDR